MNRGVPPTALNARTGEFTPPGVTARARANSAADPGVDSGVTRLLSPSRASTTNSDPYVLCVRLVNPSGRVRRRGYGGGSSSCKGRMKADSWGTLSNQPGKGEVHGAGTPASEAARRSTCGAAGPDEAVATRRGPDPAHPGIRRVDRGAHA